MDHEDVIKSLAEVANKKKAEILARFFKTGKGEYGFGDVFIGVVVPEQRTVAKKFEILQLSEIQKLIKSKIHEHRLTALLILVKQFEKGDDQKRTKIYNFYLKNTKYINNWDLVDLSAPNIIGKYLYDKPRSVLYDLVKSKSIWDRRISIISTFYFIKNKDFKDTLKISELLLSDKEPLIHKAVGWMLREVGKKKEDILVGFLNKYTSQMSRTSLRYSIERFEEKKRQKFLNKI
jgi:3-methyladenine DNA glycosylase AlkD